MRKYLIYKTTNKINGKYYIGAHETENINDGYLGSGKYLKRAIKKYGKENFEKIILKECSSQEDMFQSEIDEINLHKNNPLCYNLKDGGIGGWNYINEKCTHCGSKNPMKNPLIVKKCTNAAKNTRLQNPEKYKTVAVKNLKKAVEMNRGKKRPDHSEFMKIYGKQMWSNSDIRKKIQDSNSSLYEICSPDGTITRTNRLGEFCKKHNIPFTTIWKITKEHKIPQKGKAKGWSCKIIQQ